ncbi:MAG: hypothetical protein AABY86_13595, partial [Bdellovibrionota bacterium]
RTLQSIIDAPPTPPRIKKRSEYPGHWIVAEFGSQQITNEELERFVEHSRMSDSQKIDLFIKADKNFAKYKELKADWIYEWWRPALKQLLYYKMLEDRAKKDGRNRLTFKTTSKEYYEIVEQAERDILKTLLDQGKGINFAREEFAKFLINNNYPYKDGEPLLDTYFRWSRSQEARIREQLRVNEVNKSEFLAAHPKANPNYFISPAIIYDLNKEAKSKIEEIFAGPDLSDEKLEKAIQDNPIVETLLKKIKTYSLRETSMDTYFTRNRAKFDAAKALLVSKAPDLYGAAKVARILHYEGVAQQLAQSEDNLEGLKSKQKTSEEAFMKSSQGNYSDFMMARLYAMAIAIRENGNREKARQAVSQQLPAVFEKIKGQLGSNDFYRERSMAHLILADLIGKKMEEELKIENISDEYTRQLFNMAVWVIKFDIKKLVANDTTEYEQLVRIYEKFEAQSYLEAYHIQKQFDANLTTFRTRKLKPKYKWDFRVNPSGEYRWNENDSINFIFE